MARVSFTLRSTAAQQGSYLGGPPPVPPPPDTLGEAVLWLDSQYSVANEQFAVNQGTGGSALDAKYGSVLGAYVYDGDLVGSGLSSNYVSLPDEAALDIAGDLELFIHVNVPSKASLSGNNLLVTRREVTAGVESFQFGMSSTAFIYGQRVGGASEYGTMSGGFAWLTDGTDFWLRVRRVASTGAWTVDYQEATSQDVVPTSGWTLNGATATPASGALDASASKLYIGGSRGGTDINPPLSIGRVVYNDGVDGTALADVNFADAEDYASSFIASTGQTVTVVSTSPDTNDPLLLTHTGDDYAYFPGVSGNSLTIPSSAEDKTAFKDNWQIIGRFAPSASTGTEQDLFVMYQGFVVAVAATGDTYRFYVGGSLANGVTAFTPDETRWWRFTRPVGNATIVIESAPDGPTKPVEEDWVEFETIASPTATTIDGVTDFYIGRSSGGVLPWKGKFYYFEAVDGAGTVRCKVDISNDVTDGGVTSFTAFSGQTVTVNRPTSGVKLAMVTRPVWLFRTDDYLEAADNALLDFDETASFTVMAVLRRFGSTDGVVLSKRGHGDATASEGYAIRSGPTPNHHLYFPHGDGTTVRFPILEAGVNDLITAVGVHTPALSTLYAEGATNTSATAIAGTMSNAHPLRVGASVAGQYFNGEVIAVAVWDRALEADEITTITEYYERTTQGVLGVREDFDWMLRADNLVLAPDGDFNGLVDFGGEINPLDGVFEGTGPGGSIGGGGSSSNIANREGSYFAAGSHCYGEVDMIWGVAGLPRTADSPPLGLTPVATGTVLVYSDQGEPQTIASGDIISESTDGFSYRHEGLPEGRWAYYSLFVRLQTGDGTEFYERGASIAVLIPKNYGSTLQLWRRIPAYYRLQDSLQGDTVYPDCLGVSEIGPVGPLFKYLSIVGFDMDRMRTTLDYMMDARDPDDAHTEVLDALAEQMGVIMRASDLGPARLRRLMGDIGSYRRSKGTAEAVEFLGQAIAGGDVTIDTSTNEITIYSTRTNYVADPKDATGLIAHRPAGNVEITAPEEFSSTTYDAYTDTYTVDGTEYAPTGTGASAGVECVVIRLLQDVYVTSGDRLCFSVHSNVGTDAIKWARAYSDDIELRDANGELLTIGISLGTQEVTDDSDTNLLTDDGDVISMQDESYFDEEPLTAPTTAAVSGISFSPLKADGARAFEVTVQTSASAGAYERCGVEFLVYLGELDDEEGDPGKFVLEDLLLEKNYLGGYFDGDTVRGGWLIDTSSISDYRWEGTPYESASIYAEEYVRTNGVIDSVLLESALPINVTPHFSIAKYDAVNGIDNLV